MNTTSLICYTLSHEKGTDFNNSQDNSGKERDDLGKDRDNIGKDRDTIGKERGQTCK